MHSPTGSAIFSRGPPDLARLAMSPAPHTTAMQCHLGSTQGVSSPAFRSAGRGLTPEPCVPTLSYLPPLLSPCPSVPICPFKCHLQCHPPSLRASVLIGKALRP